MRREAMVASLGCRESFFAWALLWWVHFFTRVMRTQSASCLRSQSTRRAVTSRK